MAEPWPADGDAGLCPDCDMPVYFTSANGSYGTWFHESGTENCDPSGQPGMTCLCGHPESHHPKVKCLRKACGCGTFRPDLRVPSPEAA